MRRMNDEYRGVSPVVGTILMVAITVVLVSVVWVMANSFLPNFSGAPKVSLRAESAGLTGDQMRIIVDSNEKVDGQISAYSVALYRNKTEKSIDTTPIKTGLIATGVDGSKISFSDDGNNLMSAGDRFTIINLSPASVYEFYLLYGGQAVGTTKWNT